MTVYEPARTHGVIRGGTIAPWFAPRWRRALYRLGVRRHHRLLGDVRRADRLDEISRLMRKAAS